MTSLNKHVRYKARQQLLIEQDGKCAICDRQLGAKLVVDHDHETGRVRGLLCRNCNLLVGHLEITQANVEVIEAYLKRGLSRADRDDVFMGVARQFARRSTCPRRSVGAVFVYDNRVIAHGYNGAPTGMPHCTDVGCIISPTTGGCNRALHAELNAITFAAKKGVRTDSSTAYLTLSPCEYCAKLMLTAGIAKVFFYEVYRDRAGIDLLLSAGVECSLLS